MKDLSNAVAYYRVSTLKQAEERSSLEYYRHRMESLGFPPESIFWDVGSGGDDTRVSYQIVLSKIRNEGIKKIYVPDLSRFSRSVPGWEEALKDFQIAGASIVTLEGLVLEFNTPEQIMMSRQMITYASYEREKNQYRSLRGHEFLRLKGKLAKPRFPYVKDPETGRGIPNEAIYQGEETVWQVAEWMIAEFLRVKNVYTLQRSIIQKYGRKKFSDPAMEPPRNDCAIRGWLKSPIIRGHAAYFPRNKEKSAPVILNAHTPLIDDATSQEVLKILGLPQPRAKQQIRNPLIGLIRCGNCGGDCILRVSQSQARRKDTPRPRKHFYVQCRKSFKHQTNREILCDRTSAYGLEIDDVEREVVTVLCENAARVALSIPLGESQAQNDTDEIRSLRSKIFRWESEGDPDLLPLINKKRAELAALESALVQPDQSLELMKRIAISAQHRSFWEDCTIEERLLNYRDFVKVVTIDRGSVSVKLKFSV